MDQNMGTKRTAASASSTIATKSHDAAEQVKDAVVEQAHQVRDKALSAQQNASDRIRGVATQLRNASETLHEEDPWVSNLADRASHSVDDVARYVSSATVQSFTRDAEQLARRQPALFFGGAFLLGLAAGRFLKSSSPSNGYASNGGTLEDGDAVRNGAINRGERASGFFPSDRGSTERESTERGSTDRGNTGRGNTRSSSRYQGNYDATFGRDTEQTGAAFRGDQTPSNVSENPAVPRATPDTLSGIGQGGTRPKTGTTGSGEGQLP